ncbi:hypothetical protein WMY93_034284 [Mugilogobius chulae]|uniref:EF-hand domain-containing protein n=1 Tax=Mugilogobius chulae TaxID=88201 RepID=A0AAW0MI72_9GOBI
MCLSLSSFLSSITPLPSLPPSLPPPLSLSLSLLSPLFPLPLLSLLFSHPTLFLLFFCPVFLNPFTILSSPLYSPPSSLQDGPFGSRYGEGSGAGATTRTGSCPGTSRYDEIFYTLMPVNGKISGSTAKKGDDELPPPHTGPGKDLEAGDCDHDGMLDSEEFALAQHLIQVKLEGISSFHWSCQAHLSRQSHRKNPSEQTGRGCTITWRNENGLNGQV